MTTDSGSTLQPNLSAKIPGSNASSRTPPPLIPLAFLFSALIAFAVAGLVSFHFGKQFITDPTSDEIVGNVHLYLLGFVSFGILGALHQFGPVITMERLLSIRLAYVSFSLLVIGISVMPVGLISQSEVLTALGGASLGIGIFAVAINLFKPLIKGKSSVSLSGLRISMGYLLITACFGVTFASTHSSFSPPTHLVLAHASFGLIGFAGISYMAVSERLWPMFLLSHGNKASYGIRAIYLVAVGEIVLASGLIWDVEYLAIAGGLIICTGIIHHFISLYGYIKNRNRKLEILHGYIFVSAACLAASIVIAILALTLNVGAATRDHLAVLTVVFVFGWLSIALLGHLHKIVPFILWGVLRNHGVTRLRNKKPIMFANLFVGNLAKLTLLLISAGLGVFSIGMVSGSVYVVKSAGLFISLAAGITLFNLTITPLVIFLRTKERSIKVSIKTLN